MTPGRFRAAPCCAITGAMMVFARHSLAFLAVPKTGTTALEAALRPHASLEVSDPPHLRHMNRGVFAANWQPFLEERFGTPLDTCAVLRAPLERLGSWYRYRELPEFDDTPLSTAGISFDDFIEGILAVERPGFAQIGSQDRFAMDDKDRVRITHLFDYAQLDIAVEFLSDRLDRDLDLPRANVSPHRALELDPGLTSALRAARAREFALYDRVAASGHLYSPQPRALAD